MRTLALSSVILLLSVSYAQAAPTVSRCIAAVGPTRALKDSAEKEMRVARQSYEKEAAHAAKSVESGEIAPRADRAFHLLLAERRSKLAKSLLLKIEECVLEERTVKDLISQLEEERGTLETSLKIMTSETERDQQIEEDMRALRKEIEMVSGLLKRVQG